MTKVKIFTEQYSSELEEDINQFIQKNNITIVDIKYTSTTHYAHYATYYSAMIIYTMIK